MIFEVLMTMRERRMCARLRRRCFRLSVFRPLNIDYDYDELTDEGTEVAYKILIMNLRTTKLCKNLPQ